MEKENMKASSWKMSNKPRYVCVRALIWWCCLANTNRVHYITLCQG